MSIARRFVVPAVLAACCAGAARAEVAVETDPFGTYLRTVVTSNSSFKTPRIWSASRLRPTYWPLNVSGDRNGDLIPYVAENPVLARWPWVAWSRHNGSDYDLAWAHWTGRGWSPIGTVETAPDGTDAFDPVISFDTQGRPYIVWVSRSPVEPGSRIQFSMFLATRWMTSLAVSEPDELAFDPTIAVLDDGTIEIRYESAQGPMVRTLSFSRPTTITDDITPFGTVAISEPANTGQR